MSFINMLNIISPKKSRFEEFVKYINNEFDYDLTKLDDAIIIRGYFDISSKLQEQKNIHPECSICTSSTKDSYKECINLDCTNLEYLNLINDYIQYNYPNYICTYNKKINNLHNIQIVLETKKIFNIDITIESNCIMFKNYLSVKQKLALNCRYNGCIKHLTNIVNNLNEYIAKYFD